MKEEIRMRSIDVASQAMLVEAEKAGLEVADEILDGLDGLSVTDTPQSAQRAISCDERTLPKNVDETGAFSDEIVAEMKQAIEAYKAQANF